jgi:hypothetical protein
MTLSLQGSSYVSRGLAQQRCDRPAGSVQARVRRLQRTTHGLGHLGHGQLFDFVENEDVALDGLDLVQGLPQPT